MRFFNWFRNKAEDVSEEVEMFSYGEQRAIPTKMNQLGNNVHEEQLVGYPWITEFNLDSKPAFRRAGAIAELTEVYESAFIVVKLGAPKGLNLSDLSQPGKQADSGEIMRFDEFPTSVQGCKTPGQAVSEGAARDMLHYDVGEALVLAEIMD